MSKFFIKRPIVAIVISILMVIVGAITITNLPVAQFPDIAPPEIRVWAVYPGADAESMEKAVATPMEQQINGVDNMDYMYSLNSTNSSSTALMVDFDLKTDPNMDLILTQSRQQLAIGQLPPEVNQIGIDVKKSLTSPMMLVALYSPKGTHDAKFLSNYAYINLNDPIARSYGVGLTQIYGAGQYAMRLWVKPDRLAKLGLAVTDVVDAVESQNTVNPAGQVGGEPTVARQPFTYAVRAQGRLETPEEFGGIVVRVNPDGGLVRVRDVAHVELGCQDYTWVTALNSQPSAIIGIYQLPGSNAVEAAKGIRKLMAKMKQSFPADMDYTVTLDTTDAVRAGMKEIVFTLLIAFVLVIFVVYLFLQDWRATLIPMVAVPVSLVATFAVFPFFGFSINTLSLFGLVLAIGLVVDDAIVVVEGIQRHIEEGLAPKDAARKAMDELTGPVVGIALVLSAVFVPTVFIPGITGRLYQQFALTIAISVIVSAFNALTLSPALGAMLLRPRKQTHGPLARFFAWFNRVFARSTNLYLQLSGRLIRKSAVALVALAAFAAASLFFAKVLPSSFLPDEDQGYMYIQMQLPEASSIQSTSEAARAVEDILKSTPGVKYCTTVTGFSLLSLTRTSYNTFFWVTLEPWESRKQIEEEYQAIKAKLNLKLLTLPQGTVFAFSPPAISGVGTSGGFQFVLEDRSGQESEFLVSNLNKFLEAARKRPEIGMITTTYVPSTPQKYVYVDKEKVLKQGTSLSDVYQTLQAFMGGQFVNYFNQFGRAWQVYVEAEAPYRANLDNIGQFYVRNNRGQMVPLSALTRFESRYGPEFKMRFNEYSAAQIVGSAAPGYSSEQATTALEEVFHQTMPPEMGFDYMGMSRQEQKAREGLPSWAVFAMSLLFVFLILAALYESWSLPFGVLLSTPVAVFGAFGTLWLRRTILGMIFPAFMVQIENDVYSQIGLVMLIGLAAKNAILIVEFARSEYEKGNPLVEAALEGARLRLRPILMTSFAFILGCVPLWIATGAGSVGRQIMGTAVIGGMLAATALAIFIIPALYVIVERVASMSKRHAQVSADTPEQTPVLGD
ncbi:MAG TPA: multidrug efflux RND transporter permease subunit [Terriglobales bacterium]|nr:multidrug efflux RND transporter permease subunit [Terriglobales bacterium]